MKRFGANTNATQSMDENNVFMVRLHLLTVMVKAALQGYPLGEFRKNAVLENANEIHRQIDKMDISFPGLSTSSHLFKQRVKLLCVMATAIVSESYPLGIHRQEAVLDNLEMIVEYAFPDIQLRLFHDVLKVA
ncbi:MAG: hypothetical protein ABIJ59_12445 [Pseudomonadota bacterium]